MLVLAWLKISFSMTGSASRISICVPNSPDFTLGPGLGYRPSLFNLLPQRCNLHWKEKWTDQKRGEKLENHIKGYAVKCTCRQSRYTSGTEMLRCYSWSSYPPCRTLKFISCRSGVVPSVDNSGRQKPCNRVCFKLYWSSLVRETSRSHTLWKSSDYPLKKTF